MARNSRPDILTPLRYGPFGYVSWMLAGFLAGAIAFLIYAVPRQHSQDYAMQLPVLLELTAIGTVVTLLGALVANLVVGRRIAEELRIQREIFSGPELPPLIARPVQGGYDLGAPIRRETAPPQWAQRQAEEQPMFQWSNREHQSEPAERQKAEQH